MNECESAFSPARARGQPLEVDLGSTCLITNVSTQGRHPATRRYPHTHWEHGRYIVEDADYLMHYDASKRQYGGPWWTVIIDEQNGYPGYRSGWLPIPEEFMKPQYVTSYELLWRAEGGRGWHSLGTFRGNSDATSEVTHALTATKGGGLHARYLRFVPLDGVNNGGALRVGVYGTVIEQTDCRSAGKRRRARALGRGGGGIGGGGASDVAMGDSALVTYTLTISPESVASTSSTFLRDGQGIRKDMWDYRLKTSRTARRLRKEEARRELKEP